MTSNLLMALFYISIGNPAISGGLFDWNWFMLKRRARLIVRIFGRGGARVFYVILGAVILVLGLITFVSALVVQWVLDVSSHTDPFKARIVSFLIQV